ncbi:hypothetical protein BR93DRAFT_973232, partial [Coniochaeta sp. PMI_546]
MELAGLEERRKRPLSHTHRPRSTGSSAADRSHADFVLAKSYAGAVGCSRASSPSGGRQGWEIQSGRPPWGSTRSHVYPPTSEHGPVGWLGVVGPGVSQSSMGSAKAARERAAPPPNRVLGAHRGARKVCRPVGSCCHEDGLWEGLGRRRHRRKVLLQGKQAHGPSSSRASRHLAFSRASKRTGHSSPGQARPLLQGKQALLERLTAQQGKHLGGQA